SFSWLMLNIIRRIRTRLPTCLSIGLGVFFAIKNSCVAYRLIPRNKEPMQCGSWTQSTRREKRLKFVSNLRKFFIAESRDTERPLELNPDNGCSRPNYN